MVAADVFVSRSSLFFLGIMPAPLASAFMVTTSSSMVSLMLQSVVLAVTLNRISVVGIPPGST